MVFLSWASTAPEVKTAASRRGKKRRVTMGGLLAGKEMKTASHGVNSHGVGRKAISAEAQRLVFLAQFVLLDLAQGVARKVVAHDDGGNTLGLGQPGVGPRA